jgi:hypothetical protein
MHRTAGASHDSHDSHDEILIARLYGDDLDAADKARALSLVAHCADCRDLFADLAVIAGAEASLPIPARPRDFTLTEADAARLRRRRIGWKSIFGLGLRRSLGGSLAGLGLVGLMLTSAVSLLGPTSSLDSFATDTSAERLNAANPADLASQGAVGVAVAPPASAGTAQLPAANPSGVFTASNPGASPGSHSGEGDAGGPEASIQTKAASPAPAAADGVGQGGTPALQTNRSEGAMDARLVWLAGFAVLFVLGLAITLLPSRLRRRGRGRLSR